MNIDQDLKRMEYIMLRLRTNKGINLKEYEKMGDIKELFARAEEFIVSGHLRKIGSFLRATEKGFLILEMITKKLI